MANYNPNYKWTKELKDELVSYILDEVPFICMELADKWDMHHLTLGKRIREVCHELGYTVSNATSAKKYVKINKNPTERELQNQASFINRYANKTVGANYNKSALSRYKVDCVAEDGSRITLTVKAVNPEQAMLEVSGGDSGFTPIRVLSNEEDKKRRSARSLINKGNL